MAFVSRLLSLLALGGVVLYAWFSVLASISPAEVRTVFFVAVGVSLVLFLRGLRVEHERRSRAGDPQLREVFNRQRERRGF
jgi:membrane protein implicated in regulation of membrane protease activity